MAGGGRHAGPVAQHRACASRVAHPLGVAINSADEIWDGAGQLADTAVQSQLDLLATQLLTFARAAWETA